jgi:hypothetical protein
VLYSSVIYKKWRSCRQYIYFYYSLIFTMFFWFLPHQPMPLLKMYVLWKIIQQNFSSFFQQNWKKGWKTKDDWTEKFRGENRVRSWPLVFPRTQCIYTKKVFEKKKQLIFFSKRSHSSLCFICSPSSSSEMGWKKHLEWNARLLLGQGGG